MRLDRPPGSLEGSDLWRKRLTLPTYTAAEAARYAQAKPQTVGYWFRGGETTGPALPGRKAGERLNYFEAVEVAFVAAFRSYGVRLWRLQRARAYFQTLLQTEYPFATEQFHTEGTRILLDWDDLQGLSDFTKVVIGDEQGQLAWAGLLGEKFETFDYEEWLGASLARGRAEFSGANRSTRLIRGSKRARDSDLGDARTQAGRRVG